MIEGQLTFNTPSARGVIDSSTAKPSVRGGITTDRGVATNSTPVTTHIRMFVNSLVVRRKGQIFGCVCVCVCVLKYKI